MTQPVAAPHTAVPLESRRSASWAGVSADVTVIVSTHNRCGYVGALVETLAGQRDVIAELVIADNGSSDGTWEALTNLCAVTRMPMTAVRLEPYDGPAVPRNTAAEIARAPILAFTDDDCLPTPGWLAALLAAFDDATVIVQGRTTPQPTEWGGPWGRSLSVEAPSGLYETANLACRRVAFRAVGGFGAKRLLSGRAFGEDVVLGAALARTGGFRFAPDALVHHRVMPASYRDFLRERMRLAGFPALLRLVPELRARAFLGVFLGPRRAITDVGVAATIVAVATLDPWPLLGLLPWSIAAWREAHAHPGRPRAVRFAQLVLADLVGCAALIAGSVRARRPLL